MNAKHLTCKFMLAKEDRQGKVRSAYVTINSTAGQTLKKSLKSIKEENDLPSVMLFQRVFRADGHSEWAGIA
jgi:hypothetical protein